MGDKGYFIEPTVFSDVQDDMTIAKVRNLFQPPDLCVGCGLLQLRTFDRRMQCSQPSRVPPGSGCQHVTSPPEGCSKALSTAHIGPSAQNRSKSTTIVWVEGLLNEVVCPGRAAAAYILCPLRHWPGSLQIYLPHNWGASLVCCICV